MQCAEVCVAADGRNADEIRVLAHFKRLFELWQGDRELRSQARNNPAERERLLSERGISLHADEVAPFWRVIDLELTGGPEHARALREWEQHPVGELLARRGRDSQQRLIEACKDRVATGVAQFDAWRRRQSARAKSESYATSLDGFTPPLFAFELSKGCSKQCWFCSFSPPKLERNFLHTPTNQELWRDILATAWDLFGPACRTSVCYHSTEPSDNPDYLDFLADFHDIFGVYPQTTTADPLKDVEWTRRILRARKDDPSNVDRFSVLTPRVLRDIHRTFTAEELLEVPLVLQNTGALAFKNHCGNALQHEKRFQLEQQELLTLMPQGTESKPQLTLECTVGFLVNMVDRSIELISPCNASARWPLGRRVYAEGTFVDAASFRAFVTDTIEHCAREHLGPNDRLAFREDLAYENCDDGFSLVARFHRHDLRGNPYFRSLGELINGGTLTTGEVVEKLVDEGMPVPTTITWLDRLYQRGLLAQT
jgi:radical SAM family RiPP maturation amino acid epimerase